MKHYINKDAVVAELNRLVAELVEEGEDTMFEQGRISAFEDVKVFINHTLEVKETEEEPVSEDLGEAADKHLVEKGYLLTTKNGEHLAEVEAKGLFKAGAKWQKEQMEKNRIAHCDNITEEQYNLETGFLDGFLDKNKRMPTFLDAIEYGMKKAQKG